MKEGLKTSSIQYNDKLSPDIWEDDKLKPAVRLVLLKISKKFIEFLKLKSFKYEDITFTGSLANFNWTNVSDIDLHIMVDPSSISSNIEFVKEFFMAKKALWNVSSDLNIKGHDVELYIQDVNESHKSTGVFSIKNDEWIVKPHQQKVIIDRDAISAKSGEIAKEIDELTRHNNENIDYQIARLKLKIRKMRQSGLERTGEYSVENLSFKILRNTGYLKKLSNLERQSMEKELSLETLKL